ncbi:hypothetical protein K1719_016697 [Acacia pycnantha]|nr:hypothetical protein K1719_016697 [Acacia pycnantha]
MTFGLSYEEEKNIVMHNASQNTLEFTKVDAVIETREMHETTEGDFVQDAQNKFSFTIVHDAALGTQDETIQRHLVQATHQGKLSPTIVLHDTECTPDGSHDMQLHLSEDLRVQATTSIKNDDEENTGAKEMHETIQRLLVQNADMLIPASIQDIATETHLTHESTDKPFVQATQDAWDITIVQKKEESHDSDIHLSKNLFNQTIASMAPDSNYKGTVGAREKCEFKGRLLGHDAQNVLSPVILYVTEATETPLIQTTQETHSSATIQDIGTDTQNICEITETLLDQANIRNQKMYPVLPSVAQIVPSSSMVHIAIDPSPSQAPEAMTSSVQDEGKSQDVLNHPSENLLVQATTSVMNVDDENIGTHVTCESIEPFVQATQEKGIGTQKICKITETMDQASQNTLKFTKVDAEKLHSVSKNQEMYRTLEKALVPVVQNVLINVERPLVLPSKIAPSTVYDADGSHDLQLHLSENLHVQATTSTMNDEEENTGTKEMHETIQRPLVQNAEDTLIPASVQDIATGIHVTHESIVKPLVHATQNAWDIAIVQKKEELYNSDIHLSKNLFNQTITSMAADYRETVGTQETYKSKRRLSVLDAQTVLSSIMAYDTAVDPAPSQASEANSSSTTPIADVCSSFKELDRLLPYLEAGVKCHPQVLNWLNTEQQRVFASSIFSLFGEVTRILRTTRRGHLTEGDRNYITKCCTVLEVVGFDASWLSYVYKCIEECGDNAEDIKRKVEETKGQASSLEAQLESIKKELALLLDKASRLDDFIES